MSFGQRAAKRGSGLRLGLFLLAAVRLAAVERMLRIEAPGAVTVGQPLAIVLSAGTDAGQGEQVGFFQAEVSLDDGKSWTAICYLDKAGPKVVQRASLTPGPAGTAVRIRVRVAFRDGLAGDVDYTGAALRWHDTWAAWREPPAKQVRIAVTAR